MKKLLNEGYQLHNFISSSGSGNVIHYGSDFLTSSGSASIKVTVPVPRHCLGARVSLPLHSILSCLDETVLAPNAGLQLLIFIIFTTQKVIKSFLFFVMENQ
jgi:hypothetical protein